MKQQFFCFSVIILILILFSCEKKEIFSPKKYIETESFQSGSSDFEVSKRFVYSEKKQLSSVWLKDGNATLTFEYNKDKTVSKITSTENNGVFYALLSYKDGLLANIQYYENNQLVRESVFSRKEKANTINKIENYVYDGFASESEGALSGMLFSELKTMPEYMRKMHKSGEKSLYSVQNITYENENISRVRLNYTANDKLSLYSTTSYDYDDKKNPFYGLPYAFLKLAGYNKNNERYALTTFENDPEKTMITINNTYSYEKKYPVYKSVMESETYITGYETVIEGKDTLVKPIWTTNSKYRSYSYTYK